MLDQIINKINKQDYENAQKDLKKIITIDSSNSKAFYLLGIINLKINNIEEAIEYFQKALALNQSIEYLFAYSEALIKNNLFVEAQNSYKKILNIDNKNEPAIVNLAYSYLLTYNYSEAEKYYLQALELKPQNPHYYKNIGNLYKKQNKITEALKFYEKGISIDSNIPEIKKGKGLILLSQKKYSEAWDYFESRIYSGQNKGTLFSIIEKNLFKNKDIKSVKKLVVVSEQGIGDKILFSSIYNDLLKCHTELKFLIDSRLNTIFKRSFGDHEYINLDNYDRIRDLVRNGYEFIYAGSLGKYFRKNSSDFMKKSFLKPNLEKVSKYELLFKNYSFKKIIGLSWKSSSKFAHNKSFELKDFKSIIKDKNYLIVSLQYGETKDLDEFNLKNENKILKINDLDLFNDIDETIALIHTLDCVVTSPNVTIHLAGAIGKKCLAFYHSEYESILNQKSKNDWYKNLKIVQFNQNLSDVVSKEKNFL